MPISLEALDEAADNGYLGGGIGRASDVRGAFRWGRKLQEQTREFEIVVVDQGPEIAREGQLLNLVLPKRLRRCGALQ